MSNYSRNSVEKAEIARKTLLSSGIAFLGCVAGFAIKLALEIRIDQKLDNEIDILEEAKKELEKGWGRLKNSKEIGDIDAKIEDLRNQKK